MMESLMPLSAYKKGDYEAIPRLLIKEIFECIR